MKQVQLQYTIKHKLLSQILKLCHQVPLSRHQNHYGPKTFIECQKVALVILFRRSGKSLRDFIAQLPELRWIQWLQLKELPSKSTLHNWCKAFPASFTRKLNALLLKKERPTLMAVDGTGLDSWQRSRHYEKRTQQSPMPYAKLDLFIDVETMLIHDHELRVKPRHDQISAHRFFRRTTHRGVIALGDMGYDSEPLHKEARHSGNLLFAPVRERKRRRIKGINRQRCSKGHEDYNKRSHIESVNHAFKARRCSALHSKEWYMKKRELAWQVLIYNLEKIIKVQKSIIKSLLRRLQSLILDRPGC